jgi:hypothetical protein
MSDAILIVEIKKGVKVFVLCDIVVGRFGFGQFIQ